MKKMKKWLENPIRRNLLIVAVVVFTLPLLSLLCSLLSWLATATQQLFASIGWGICITIAITAIAAAILFGWLEMRSVKKGRRRCLDD